jgi:hypothetical protein
MIISRTRNVPYWAWCLGGYAVVVAGLLLMTGCAVSREQVPSDLLPDYDAAEALLADEDPTNDAEAEAVLAEIEGRVLRRQAEPFAGLLPYGLGGALTSLVPLLGRRGRRHYGAAVKSLSRGRVLTAAGDVLKAMGAQHSSPASEAAAVSPSPSQPPSPS